MHNFSFHIHVLVNEKRRDQKVPSGTHGAVAEFWDLVCELFGNWLGAGLGIGLGASWGPFGN